MDMQFSAMSTLTSPTWGRDCGTKWRAKSKHCRKDMHFERRKDRTQLGADWAELRCNYVWLVNEQGLQGC